MEFLVSTIDSLPESSDVHETFRQYLEDLEDLTAEIAQTGTLQKSQHGLISEFEIQARPGTRPTKHSQKLRQESDRANMTTSDEEYTKLVDKINIFLKELFLYLSLMH